jgi:hypothetical protein
MRRETPEEMMGKAKGFTDNCLQSDCLRLKKTAFTRKRRLGAANILRIIVTRIYSALQLTLDRYFNDLGEEPVSKQAFSKARAAIDPEYVRKYADMTSEVAAKDDTMARYNGRNLVAIDGTDLSLENSDELKEAFGCSGPTDSAATAAASFAFDPINLIVYDCRIDKCDTGERDMALKHMGRLNEIGLDGALLLMDRGYPSVGMLAAMMRMGFSFLMRVKRKWDAEVDKIEKEGWREIEEDGEIFRIRVLKVELDSGEIEMLLTNLDETQLARKEAKELYFKRWKIETSFDMLKSKLQAENFSGKTEVSVLQDFYATVFLMNMANAIASVSDGEIASADKGKRLKHPRVANRNRAISKLREDFLKILLEPDKAARRAMLDRVISTISRRPLSVVSGRKRPRKAPRKKPFHITRKAVVY